MAASRLYGEDLRSIGQALEARDIIDFELKRLAESYIILVRLIRAPRYVRAYASGCRDCVAVLPPTRYLSVQ